MLDKDFLLEMRSTKEGRIKILQVATVDITVQKLMLPLIDGLMRNGFIVHIACAKGEYFDDLISRGYDLVEIPFKRRTLSMSHLTSLWKLYVEIKKQDYLIVHLHTPIAAALGRIAAKIAGRKPIIYTAHGFYFHENTPLIVREAIVIIEKLLCKYATDWLLTVSEEDAQFAGDKGFLRKDRIVCIGNGVEIDKYTKSFPRKEIRDSLGIAEDEKVIGFIGRIVREKGVVDLARAYLRVLERFPEARLLVIGETLPSDRDKKAKQMLEGFITENNLDNKVIFTGFRDDIPELLSIMDVFVLPSYREGMPNTILEAMASGKPVIATNIRGCREEVINERTGLLVERSDVDGLAKAILGIISNTDLAKAMGEKGKERAFAKYNEDEMVRKQLDIYWRIIEEVKHKDGQPVK